MTDVPNQEAPTEEQVKAANEAEEARWQGDFKEEDLAIPYKREADAEKPKEEPEPPAKEEEKVATIEPSAEPGPVITVEDPGEYQPADYSFEVTLKDGKTVKVATSEEAEKLADDPDNFETPKQLLDFINKQNKMNRNLERDYEKWESQKKTFTDQLEAETQRRETIDTYVGEFQYLVTKGLMPPIDEQYLEADWSDPEVAKQPGVKEQIELLTYMDKENAIRAKAKVNPLSSIVDAYNAWQQDEKVQSAKAKVKPDTEAHKAAGEARKGASARIAGVSPAQQGTFVPKGIAVGNPNVFRRGASVWDD